VRFGFKLVAKNGSALKINRFYLGSPYFINGDEQAYVRFLIILLVWVLDSLLAMRSRLWWYSIKIS